MSTGSGGLLLPAFLALVLLTASRICAGRCRGGPDALLGAFVWGACLVLADATILSFRALLTPLAMTLLAALGAAIVLLLPLAPRGAAVEPAAEETTRLPPRQAVGIAVGLLPALAFAVLALFLAFHAPETGDDNLAYHLPRLGYWIGQRAVAAFPANDPRIGSFPPVGNVLQLVPALFLRSDRLCGAVQIVSMAAAGLGIYATARAIGSPRDAALFAVLGWFAVPGMAVQAPLTMVDVTASAFLVASSYFLVRRPERAFHLFTSLLASGLAVGTKPHLLVMAGPLAVAAAIALVRRHRPAVPWAAAGLAAAALPLGGAFAIQNQAVWGHPDGLPAVRYVVFGPGLASLVKNVELLLVPVLSWWPGGGEWTYHWKETLTGEGLGLYWLLAAGVSLGLLAWDRAVRRERGLGPWLGVAGLSVGALLVLAGVLRHQHAVYRFVLPVAAVLTVLHARGFERLVGGRAWRAWVLLGLAWCASAWVLGWHGYWQASRRWAGVGWVSEAGRYGPRLEAFAAELRGRSPLRVGVVTGQYFPEGLFFGRRYRHTVVPLSQRLPATLPEIEAMGLDALWVTTGASCRVELFRRDFRAPAALPTASWSPATRGFDTDFFRAYDSAVEMVSTRPMLQALAEPGSPWGVVVSNPTGALFVRGEGRRIEVGRLCGGQPG